MPETRPPVAIARLREAWDEEIQPSARRALAAMAVAAVVIAAELARFGSTRSRGIAAGVLALVLVGVIVRALVLRRRRLNERRIIADTLAKTDPELGAATLRALTLVERTTTDERAGSAALARLHLSRLLGRASLESVSARAARVAAAWSSLGFGLALVAALATLIAPLRVVEGLDVLVAREGDAPLMIRWMDEISLRAIPPEYLHLTAADLPAFVPSEEPRGTTLVLRGRPLHSGRALVVTDGKSDVPFVDDGAGGLIARWTLGDSTTLWIAARFGEVRIRQADGQEIVSIPDELPVVEVEGAPRQARLLEEPSIPIHYEASDDHGLREINLVLRAGSREERRVLAKPAEGARVDRGGYELKASDSFFKRTFVPVEVTVEARDNDVVSGPKWGKSASIMVIPPQVGEAEALRLAALRSARDAVTDLCAARVLDKSTPTGAEKQKHLAKEAEAQDKATRAVQEALFGTYGGLRVRGRFLALARGQLRRLSVALEEEKKRPSADRHQKLVEETERALLAFDAGVRALGVRDSRIVAKRLADVADEAADACGVSELASNDQKSAEARLDAALLVLDGGGKQMLRLGALGQDLGEIVAADLRRIARARAAKDMMHAELSARDLAARLRRPYPSFSGGGGHGHGGVESGGGGQTADSEDASSADEEAAELERELEQIVREHAAQMDEVESSLERAIDPEEIEALKDEAKRHAEAVRKAIERLPSRPGDADSAEGKAAAAREQAEAMAGSLENGELRGALEEGRRASRSLEDAKRAANEAPGFFPEERAGREASAAKDALERELAWVQDALDKLRSASSERAKEDLSKAGKGEEKLAQRTQGLGQKADSGDRSMPQEMLDRLEEAEQAMRDAQKALEQGDGEGGLRHQREAQRLLEMAQGERGEEGEKESSQERDGKALAKDAKIPDKDRHKGPEDFRRRVLEGLSEPVDPLLREAVKRYAEGLLK